MTLAIPCGHDGMVPHCSLYRNFRERDDLNRAWGGPGVVAAAPHRPRAACRRRGAELRQVECPTCPKSPAGGVRLKVLACAVHGECTVAKRADGVKACCADCPDWEPGPAIQVEAAPAGIGDDLLALCVAEGLRRRWPSAEVVTVCPHGMLPWLRLFDDRVRAGAASGPRVSCHHNDPGRWWSRGLARWQFWAKEAGVEAVLPEPRPLPADAAAWARPHAGAVVLAPFAAWPDRCWPLDRWLEVERLLLEAGRRCVVLDDRPRRCDRFRSPKLIGEAPARVAAVIRQGAAFAGNDSGMAHLSGMLRVPGVAVSSRASDPNIMGLYPTVTELGGRARGYERVTAAEVVAALGNRPPPPAAAAADGGEWASAAQLAADAVKLAGLLPADVTAVVGVPRSGMIAAAVVATVRHLPLWSLGEDGALVRLGHARGGLTGGAKVALVDDTVYTGGAMGRAAEACRAAGLEVVRAAVYLDGGGAVDAYVRRSSPVHVREWSVMNRSGWRVATDLDGVLTVDGTDRPWLLPRADEIPLIATGRAESRRGETEEWLRRHGVRWARLAMRPDGEPDDGMRNAAMKAAAYAASDCTVFLESDQDQAAEIHRITGRLVVCPTTGRVFAP